MDYTEFVSAVERRLSDKLEGGVKISPYTAMKNNGKERRGIIIETPGINVSPTIYLEEYYEWYERGKTLGEIVKDIHSFYVDIRQNESWDYGNALNWEGVRGRVVFKLINTRKNSMLLKEMPHRKFLDLSVVYYVLVEMNCEGSAVMQIYNSHMRHWGTDEETLWSIAVKNSKELLAAELFTISHALRECLPSGGRDVRGENLLEKDDDTRDGMYVLTNRTRNYGAACMAYPYVLEMIGDILERDYYILPSSVHEVIIVPDLCGVMEEELDEMIRDVNHAQVAAEEVLGDHAYFFEQGGKRLLPGKKKSGEEGVS